MNRRIPAGILVLVLLLSATPWEAWRAAEDSSPLALQSAGLNDLGWLSLAVDSCCVCLCPFTSSSLNFLAIAAGSMALLPANAAPRFSEKRSLADPPLRLVFHPPRRT